MIEKYETMKKLEKEIKENLFDMDMIIDLMVIPKYSNSKILEKRFKELQDETIKLKEEYHKLSEEIDLIDDVCELLLA